MKVGDLVIVKNHRDYNMVDANSIGIVTRVWEGRDIITVMHFGYWNKTQYLESTLEVLNEVS
jgi:hypothetical protein